MRINRLILVANTSFITWNILLSFAKSETFHRVVPRKSTTVVDRLMLIFIWLPWQVSLWDRIIPDKNHANVQVEVKSKYPLIDQVKLHSVLPHFCHITCKWPGFVLTQTQFVSCHQGRSLRGKKVQFVLHWHIMPNAGRMMRGKMPLSEFNLPDSYTSWKQRDLHSQAPFDKIM